MLGFLPPSTKLYCSSRCIGVTDPKLPWCIQRSVNTLCLKWKHLYDSVCVNGWIRLLLRECCTSTNLFITILLQTFSKGLSDFFRSGYDNEKQTLDRKRVQSLAPNLQTQIWRCSCTLCNWAVVLIYFSHESYFKVTTFLSFVWVIYLHVERMNSFIDLQCQKKQEMSKRSAFWPDVKLVVD